MADEIIGSVGRPLPDLKNIQLRQWIKDHILGSDEWAGIVDDIATASAAAIQKSLLTTRGDMIRRSATEPERFAKGAQNTLLAMGANDPDWATLSALIDAAIGSTRGSILYRSASGWAIRAPGTSGYVLASQGSGADPDYAAITHPKWTQIEARTVDGDEVFTGLDSYTEIIGILKSVTSSSSGTRNMRVSIDGGSNYLTTSGDYFQATGAAGTAFTEVILAGTAATALSVTFRLTGLNHTGSKHLWVSSGSSYEIGTASPINAIKIYNSAGTPNGGTIYLSGLPTS